MDHYSTLGVTRTASQDEIKKAYRSLAMKHHPDRGGDEKKFKEVEEAYRTLSDPEKKQIYDLGGDPNNTGMGGFEFNSGNFDDIFRNFGFGFRPRQRQNQSISISVSVTLEEVLTGKTLDAEITMPGGARKLININIPAGVEHGQQIRYPQMGSHSIAGLPPGDLIVSVQILGHAVYIRDRLNLFCDKKISVTEAILGTELEIITLDKKHLTITVPAGAQPDMLLNCKGEGLPHMRTGQRGNLFVRIKVDIPKNLNILQKQLVEQLKQNGI
jgi:DnaJ-class molecular chaperone